MTKKTDSLWFQFDSNAACTVTYIRKIIFTKLTCCVTFPDHCVPHARWKPNQHDQNFMILANSVHKVMSKC